MMRFRDVYHACDVLRQKERSMRLPIVLFWQSLKGQHHWTRFARNGRIIGASSEGFSSAKIACRNYDLCHKPAKHVYRI